MFLKLADQDNLVYFYDVNAKVNWRANNKNRFFLALYAGRDDFNFDGELAHEGRKYLVSFAWVDYGDERRINMIFLGRKL